MNKTLKIKAVNEHISIPYYVEDSILLTNRYTLSIPPSRLVANVWLYAESFDYLYTDFSKPDEIFFNAENVRVPLSVSAVNLIDVMFAVSRLFTPKTDYEIYEASVDIARKTRRGVGNFVLTHPQNRLNPHDVPKNCDIYYEEHEKLENWMIVGYRSKIDVLKPLVDCNIVCIDGFISKFLVLNKVPTQFRRIRIR